MFVCAQSARTDMGDDEVVGQCEKKSKRNQAYSHAYHGDLATQSHHRVLFHLASGVHPTRRHTHYNVHVVGTTSALGFFLVQEPQMCKALRYPHRATLNSRKWSMSGCFRVGPTRWKRNGVCSRLTLLLRSLASFVIYRPIT